MTDTKPLTGIRVIDLTRVLAGPFCTMVLKQLGAEIVKIEAPCTGDDARQFGPFLNDDPNCSTYFINLNCGKKSLSMDLKKDLAKKILSELIKISDVLVENYRPGTLARLGFSEESISQLNSSIIYASLSGFGHTGPESNQPAYDATIQALSGLISITGTEDGQCVRVGTSIADIITGLYTTIGILSALLRRQKLARGSRIDIAMLDSVVAVLENALARYQTSGNSPMPLGTRHPSIAPFDSFRTKDYQIIIAAGNDRLFRNLCEIIDKPHLTADKKYLTNSLRIENCHQLKDEIEQALSNHNADYWLSKLKHRQIPSAKINKIEDIFQLKQLSVRNMLIPVEEQNGYKIAGNPIKFTDLSENYFVERPPELGQHSRDILKNLLGYTDGEIEALYIAKVLS